MAGYSGKGREVEVREEMRRLFEKKTYVLYCVASIVVILNWKQNRIYEK